MSDINSSEGFLFINRAVNNELLDTYQLKSLDGLLEYDINDYKVVRQGGHLYLRENPPPGSQWEEYDNDPLLTPYDKIIRCLGFQFDSSIFRKYDGSLLCVLLKVCFSYFSLSTRSHRIMLVISLIVHMHANLMS